MGQTGVHPPGLGKALQGEIAVAPLEAKLPERGPAQPFRLGGEGAGPQLGEGLLVQGVQPEEGEPPLGVRALQEGPPPLLEVFPAAFLQDRVVQVGEGEVVPGYEGA